jgi:hypothetical protein
MDEQEVHGRFLLLIEEYRLAAWVGLGKLKDPHSGEVKRNLDLARHAIDTLGMLEVKTRDNRSEEEERILHQALADLRINFVEEMKAGERESHGDEGEAAAEAGAAAEETPAEAGAAEEARAETGRAEDAAAETGAAKTGGTEDAKPAEGPGGEAGASS